MYDFLLKEKVLLIIGLFQFGLILIMFAIVNWGKLILGKRNVSEENSPTKIKSVAIASGLDNGLGKGLDNALSTKVEDVLNDSVPTEPDLETNVLNLNVEHVINQPEQTSAIDTEALEENLTYKVDIAPELLTELKEISNDPTAIIDEAIRWWLRRRTFNVLDSSPDRKDRVGLRSYGSKRLPQDLWND